MEKNNMDFTKEDAQKVFDEKTKEFKISDVNKVFNNWEKIYDKVKSSDVLGKFVDDVVDLYNMLKDYVNGDYKDIPMGTIAAIVITLLYVFSPIDVIPDIIPAIGLIDDALILGVCLEFVAKDLEKYREWKKNKMIIK